MANSLKELRIRFIDCVSVALGCIPGAIIRWQIHNDLLVNLLGCCIVGFIYCLSLKKRAYLFFGFGFCGSLTTFSGFILKTVSLFESRNWLAAYSLISLHVGLGLIATTLGFLLGRKLK